MDIHIASMDASNSLPQGFSVYQPSLGAQLQFFPAMGTQDLDNMLHTYLPGPASIADKRAAVAVDFLEHLHLTGQPFKFYQVEALVACSSASATSSPSSGSGISSFPATPSWDFTNIATPASTSSQTSTPSLKARKAAKAASRHQTTDFSHLPGMKIMTRDGLDVTNAASRGSKTKEQRDHAHLMRIIKACDACRAKKIRCDPSHKKRAASASLSATPQLQASSSIKSKKAKMISKPTPPTIAEYQSTPAAYSAPLDEFRWADFDASAAMASMDDLDTFTTLNDSWGEFMEFPDSVPGVDDYGIFVDSDGNLSPGSSFSTTTPTNTTASGSSTKPHTPTNGFASEEVASSRLASTNRHTSTGDDRDILPRGLASIGESCCPIAPLTGRPPSGDDGVLRLPPADGSGVPGDQGIDATLLSSIEMVSPLHRLEDPGIWSNTASPAELSDVTPPLSELSNTSHSEAIHVSSSGETTALQHQPLGGSSVGQPHAPTSTTVHDPARSLVRTESDSVPGTVAPTAMRTRNRLPALLGGQVGILGLLPMSGPIVPGLAQLLLGGTSELIAASPPLSSRTPLAMLQMAMAVMATSFVASVGNMLAADQVSLLRTQVGTKKASSSTAGGPCGSWNPSALPMTSLVGGVC